jgi:uncharacterized protein
MNDSGLAAPTLVLDSNVAFDWLVFADPATAPLRDAITGGRVRWLATEAMRDEAARVLARGAFAKHIGDTHAVMAEWCRWATIVPASATCAGLRCGDPDDQKFVDLAVHAGAQALLSRDRAVLALATRAQRIGLSILRPGDWPA